MQLKIVFFISFLLSVFFFSNLSFSQKSEYLGFDVLTEREYYSESDTIKIALSISIIKPYHINSYKVDDPTLITTSVSVSDSNFKILNSFFPESKKLKFEFSENRKTNISERRVTDNLTKFILRRDTSLYKVND